MIDPKRIGIAGHSLGGDAVVTTMAQDKRVRAGVNMDGAFSAQVPATGLDHRLFLMLGTETDHTVGGSDCTWGPAWANLNGWKRWLAAAGPIHATFTDLTPLADELRISLPGMKLSGLRGMEITRAYAGAFFDLTLKGIPQPLLDGPSPAYPEVAFPICRIPPLI
ncbi:hypothetical protein ACWGCW_35120 [Streptomyces sp. NPDC054933]